MNRSRAAGLSLIVALVLLAPTGLAQSNKFERSFPFQGDTDTKVGITVGDITIESFRIRHWPDADDFHKAEKDLNDTHTMVIQVRYSNKDRDHDYKCSYVATIPGGADGKPFRQNDRTATLDKGKTDDTNSFFVKMKTNDYKLAKTIKMTFEISKK